MGRFTDALEALLEQHRRIGSPVPDYLRPGLPADRARDQIVGGVGLDPPTFVLELFAWHDGIDDDAWVRDGVGTGFARLFGDTYFAPLAEAIGAYHEAIEIDRTTAMYGMGDEPTEIWTPTWFPVFCRGWDTWSVECNRDSPDLGRVYDVYWHPPIDDPAKPRFRDLVHLVESVVRRFEAGGYRWDAGQKFLLEENTILLPLYDAEIAEARG